MAETDNNIAASIPHRPPFVMVDRLIHVESTLFTSTFNIIASNILLDGEHFSTYGLIENIAQTASAGLFNVSSDPVITSGKGGYIGSVANVQVHQLPPVGAEIKTNVTIRNTFGNMVKVYGETFLNTVCLLECEMSIVVVK